MKRRRKLNREQLVFIVLAAAAVLSLLAGRAKLAEAAAGERSAKDIHQLTHYDARYNDGGLRVGYFEIDGGIIAMCVCHELDSPTQPGTPLVTNAVYTAENHGNDLMRKIYYYGWNGPGDVGASFVETCLAGSVANGHDDNFYGFGQAFIDRIAALPGAPRGFDVYVVSDGDNTKQDLAFWDYNPTGWLKLKKGHTEDGLVENNSCYTLKGAQYGVYTEEACESRKAVLVTNAEGNTAAEELEPGTYYVKEIKAPEGYRLDPEAYPITVVQDETRTLEVEETPVWDTLGLMIDKQDAESMEGHPLGAASLAGAEFKVCFYGGYYTAENLPEEPERTWILETKEVKMSEEKMPGESLYLCRLEEEYRTGGDSFYEVDGCPVLPLGTITIEETGAPKGYLLDKVFFQNDEEDVSEERYLTRIAQNGDTAQMEGGNAYTAYDYVIRGDLELVKIADGTHARLAGVPFQLTSNTTGESHIIITDENGQASTEAGWNLHTGNTNMGECAEDGIWFGIKMDGTLVEPEDARGALPYDTYTVEELPCESNRSYELVPPFTVTVSRDKAIVHLGTVTNDEPETEVPEEPKKPKTPEKQEEPVKTAPVRTGDAANMSIWLITCILSCVVIITCVMIARRMKKR